LRWTTRSTRNLAGELRRQGHAVLYHSVARLLATELGYSLKGNAKTIEGGSTPTGTASSVTSAGRSPRTWPRASL